MVVRASLRSACFLMIAACAALAAAAPPNVVLIVSDDQHWGDYGFMGHASIRTPNLDRLARESLVFPRGYVTSSLCCPSLASLITGRYPLPHSPFDPPRELLEHYRSRTDSVHVARYWANVERFDRTIGDLLDFLDREKLAADTLVVYVTDNGWIQDPARQHFAPRSKLSPYDGGLRTPIMLRRPGTIAPRSDGALASTLDIMPTILAACGATPPAGLPGVNLLDAERSKARTQVFGECYTHTVVDLDDPARSLLWRWTVRAEADGRIWKVIVPTTADRADVSPRRDMAHVDAESRARHAAGTVELFDVAADPAERRNLAAEQPDVVARLRHSLDAWWQPDGGQPRAERRD